MRVLIVLCLALPALARSPPKFIVGGGPADEGEWPWQLVLRNSGSFSCGANLISATYAVTAAHCIGGVATQYSVVAGTNQRSCGDGNCETRTCNSAVRHPGYVDSDPLGYPNDVGVLGWTAAINQVDGKIQYVVMSQNPDHIGQTCYITGWGRLSGGGTLPEDLQEALVDILTTPECEDLFTAESVSDMQICVYDRVTQERGACNGDSGGPLVCQDGTGAWLLAGATSWGATGCSTATPSVYTRISSYYDWIVANSL